MSRPERSLTLQGFWAWCLAALAAIALIHCALALLMERGGVSMGAVSASLTPLYAYWNPHFKPWLLLPLVASLAFVRTLRATQFAIVCSDSAAILFFMCWFLILALCVPLIDGGPGIWIAPYVSRPKLEYYGAIDQARDIPRFLRTYVDLSDTLPMHARVHPPGAIVLLAWLTRGLGGGPWAAALGTIGFSALAVPFVFGLARSIGGPHLARLATAVFVATPSILLYSATSMDGPFMVFLIATLWAFWRALQNQPLSNGLLAGSLGAASALLTYSVAIVLIFCVLAGLWLLGMKPFRRNTLVAGAGFLAAFVLIHLGIWLGTGFNPLAMLSLAIHADHKIMAGTSHESVFRHCVLTVGHLGAFFISLGVPTLALYLKYHSLPGSAAGNASPHSSALRTFCVCGLATILVAAVLPVYTMEVERIWLFLVPLVVIPGTFLLLSPLEEEGINLQVAPWVIRLLLFQTLLTEVLLGTYW